MRVLFATYAMRAAPLLGPTMIGVLKRCLRLIEHLPPGAVEAHWVHSGPVFEDDPLVRSVAPSLPRYDLHGRPLGSRAARPRQLAGVARHRAFALPRAVLAHGPQHLYMERGMRRLLSDVRPDVVVLGENPLGGVLRAVARAARAAEIPTVAIDGHLSPGQPVQLVRSAPDVRAWLLIGLPFEEGVLDDTMVLAPPLLAAASASRAAPVDLTILGYDLQVARFGLELLARLPPGTRGRVIAAGLDVPASLRRALTERGSLPTLEPPPADPDYRAQLEATRVVVGKSGFQQIVEALALGVPVVACEARGGVRAAYLGPALRPFIRFVNPAQVDWNETLADVGRWLAAPPVLPWTREIQALPHPARRASELLLDLLRRVVARAPARRMLGATP